VTDRISALQALAVGDVFHGRSPNGASLICLVTDVTETTICARRITTQDDREFDRQTGMSLDDVGSRIDCVAPLPPNVHVVLLAYDQRGQEVAALFRSGSRPPDEQYRPTPEERQAFQYLRDHVAANPI
jgi:hypothetical protein